MKKKASFLLSVLVTMVAIWSTSITSFSDSTYYTLPYDVSIVSGCHDSGILVTMLFVPDYVLGDTVYGWYYDDFSSTATYTQKSLATNFNNGEIIRGRIYHSNASNEYTLCNDLSSYEAEPIIPSDSTLVYHEHTHDFVTGIIYDATCNSDGLEGTYCKTCGYVLNSSPIPAMGYTLETYAKQKIDAAKSGQKIVLEFGELNSFPKSFMEDVAEKVAAGVTFEFRYNWNHKLQKITIPAYCTVDTALDWYGPATMQQLYGAY